MLKSQKIRDFIDRLKERFQKKWTLAAKSTLTVLLLLFIAWNAALKTTARPIEDKSDQAHHILVARNIFHFGTHAVPGGKSGALEPTAYREPLYTVFLAAVIALHPSLHGMTGNELLGKEAVRIFQHALIAVLLITIVASMLSVLMISHKWALALAVLPIVGFSRALLDSIETLKVELFAAMWVVLLSTALLKMMLTRKPVFGFLSGLCLGLLVLDRAIFMYLVFLVLAGAPIVWWTRYRTSKKFVVGVGLFLLAYALVVCPWLIRNRVHFGSFFITFRAGVILAVRSQYDTMNSTEYKAAFLYWMPGPEAKQALTESFKKGYDRPGAPLARLNRADKNSFYQNGRRMRRKIFKKTSGTEIEKEQRLKQLALQKIKSNPWGHLSVSLPVAWRSLFVEEGLSMKTPPSWRITAPVTLSLLYFLSFFVAMTIAALRRRPDILIAGLPVFYLFSINALFTHGLPRYNQPAIPVLVVFVGVLVQLLLDFRSNRKKPAD